MKATGFRLTNPENNRSIVWTTNEVCTAGTDRCVTLSCQHQWPSIKTTSIVHAMWLHNRLNRHRISIHGQHLPRMQLRQHEILRIVGTSKPHKHEHTHCKATIAIGTTGVLLSALQGESGVAQRTVLFRICISRPSLS